MKISTYIKINILFWGIISILSCSKDREGTFLEEQKNNKEAVSKTVTTTSNGDLRQYIVYVPSTYDENKEHPLVFQLHGSSGDGEKFYNISGWKELAEMHGFIAVYPTSYVHDLRLNGCGNDLVTNMEQLQSAERSLSLRKPSRRYCIF